MSEDQTFEKALIFALGVFFGVILCGVVMAS